MWKVTEKHPSLFIYVPDQLKTGEMYNKVVEEFPFLLEDVPDNLKDAGEGGGG